MPTMEALFIELLAAADAIDGDKTPEFPVVDEQTARFKRYWDAKDAARRALAEAGKRRKDEPIQDR